MKREEKNELRRGRNAEVGVAEEEVEVEEITVSGSLPKKRIIISAQAAAAAYILEM